MQLEHFSLNGLYQHRDFKRAGRAVRIENSLVTLQDVAGDNFIVNLTALEHAPAKHEGDFWIDLNVNYPKEHTETLQSLWNEREHI